jgi:hypothetical protein
MTQGKAQVISRVYHWRGQHKHKNNYYYNFKNLLKN